MPIALSINGETHTLDAPADMPLLWALRDVIGLTGTKYGCGIAQCGACTVEADGAPVRACSITLGDLAGVKITTIEGLSSPAALAVQDAWTRLDVAQCGYCQSGQVMSASLLLQTTPKPTDDEIDAAMSGNLCRCATYVRIRAAIHAAADSLGAHHGA